MTNTLPNGRTVESEREKDARHAAIKPLKTVWMVERKDLTGIDLLVVCETRDVATRTVHEHAGRVLVWDDVRGGGGAMVANGGSHRYWIITPMPVKQA